MRIAIFTDTFTPQINGVTNTLNRLRAYLNTHGHQTLFFAPDYGTHEADDPEVVRYRGIHPVFYPECCLAFPNPVEIRARLEAFAPDVIHVVTEFGIGYAGLKAARELDIPLVMSYHTNIDKYLTFYHLPHLVRPLNAYMKWFHSFARLNLCPSEDTKRRLREQGMENLDVWSRGIDASHFSPDKRSESLRQSLGAKDRLIFLYTGRISAEKGLDTLMESIRIINKRHGDSAMFVLTGDGPYTRTLQEMNIPNVAFTGFLSGEALARMYASSDAFVFPSGTETFGNVVLEAMASGLPVVCVDEGGITDFTSHMHNAAVCRCGNAQSLADGMERMIQDGFMRQRLAAASLATARARSWESIFAKLVRQYGSVLSHTEKKARVSA